jgi:hypothetical protein
MEKKKQLLIKVLTKLKPYRSLAEAFIVLIKSEYCTHKTINGLIGLLYDSLKMMKTEKNKEVFQKGLQQIQKIRQQEEQEKEDEQSLEQLLENK